jgi:hypothetical protein
MRRPFQSPSPDAASAAFAEYNARAASDARLVSVAFPMDDDGTDGYTISVVRATDE